MAKTVHYRFESFLYPAHVSRIELEAEKLIGSTSVDANISSPTSAMSK